MVRLEVGVGNGPEPTGYMSKHRNTRVIIRHHQPRSPNQLHRSAPSQARVLEQQEPEGSVWTTPPRGWSDDIKGWDWRGEILWLRVGPAADELPRIRTSRSPSLELDDMFAAEDELLRASTSLGGGEWLEILVQSADELRYLDMESRQPIVDRLVFPVGNLEPIRLDLMLRCNKILNGPQPLILARQMESGESSKPRKKSFGVAAQRRRTMADSVAALSKLHLCVEPIPFPSVSPAPNGTTEGTQHYAGGYFDEPDWFSPRFWSEGLFEEPLAPEEVDEDDAEARLTGEAAAAAETAALLQEHFLRYCVRMRRPSAIPLSAVKAERMEVKATSFEIENVVDEDGFNAFLRHQGLLGVELPKKSAADIFDAHAFGALIEGGASRVLGSAEFARAVTAAAEATGRSVRELVVGIWDSMLTSATKASCGEVGWCTEYPLHAAAASGDLERLEKLWSRLRKEELREAAQLSGRGRDIPYLVSRLLKVKRRGEFRVRSNGRVGPQRTSPWAQSGGLVAQEDPGGWTALHHAVVNGHAEAVLRLVIWGWDPNRPARRTCRTPLHMACERPGPFPPVIRRKGGGDVELIAGLLRMGADPSRPDADGKQALEISAPETRLAVFSSDILLDANCTLLSPKLIDQARVERLNIITGFGSVMAARPGHCRLLFLACPPTRDLCFPWHQTPAGGVDPALESAFEVSTREFEGSAGRRPDESRNDVTTNFGADMPVVVRDRATVEQLFSDCGYLLCGTGTSQLTRRQTLERIRNLLRIQVSTDVFCIVYSGNAQKHSGRLILISDSPSSGTWVAQHRSLITPYHERSSAILGANTNARPSASGPFPYTFARPDLLPETVSGSRKNPGGVSHIHRAKALASSSRALKRGKSLIEAEEDLAAELAAEEEAAEKAEAAKFIAVMASCRYQERAGENAAGGLFMQRWASLPIQRRIRLEGVKLRTSPLQVSGAACRQHPALSIGWCRPSDDAEAATGGPRMVCIGAGLYLVGGLYFEEENGAS